MKLDSENRPRLVRHSHHSAIFGLGVHGEVRRKRIARDHQRVIARRPHRRRTTFEQPFVRVLHFGHFAMNGHRAANDASAKRFANRLMAEADAEKRDFLVGADEIDDAASAGGRARAGRDDDRFRVFRDQRGRIECVVADDANRSAGEALDLLDQVVGEGVVVIDDDEARAKEAPGSS